MQYDQRGLRLPCLSQIRRDLSSSIHPYQSLAPCRPSQGVRQLCRCRRWHCEGGGQDVLYNKGIACFREHSHDLGDEVRFQPRHTRKVSTRRPQIERHYVSFVGWRRKLAEEFSLTQRFYPLRVVKTLEEIALLLQVGHPRNRPTYEFRSWPLPGFHPSP